ncbi:discoidin domain-containing protein [Myxococcus sp. AM010]|uniref:galactose-binding domain-containing protein n=1 Tax=Myxococcus sp. AM010 TaxID=2745138 RepID=UPI001594F661|nr:discoidin domain-containing protein [Myxococcus sp. AM010]NVJ17990.1 discoidin domain-containing protein [Myxococcus sp. AM010]
MTSSLTFRRDLLIGLACAALVVACAPQETTSTDSREDSGLDQATLALSSPPNLALGKPASQSSTTHSADASRAVDGNTEGAFDQGSVTHTDNTWQPWWQVDLEGVHAISSVVVYNRTDCCSERLQNFRVRVSDDGLNWQDFSFTGIAPAQSVFAINRTARFVRVQLDGTAPLSLAEVQVLPAHGNVALGKPASQSSTTHSADASRAVDGNTEGAFDHASVTHTDNTWQPWWQVDLEGVHAISSVVVYNRTDCCSERLQNFRVRVSDDGLNWQDFSFTGIAPAQSIFAINRMARFVRVQLDGTDPLSLAEVQVFGVPPSPSELLISVDTAGCNTNVAINNAIGQSFRVNGATDLDKIEVWIKPELYYTTSYAMEVYDGEGTGGAKLATSPTTVTLGSLTAGVPAAFRGFSFTHQGVTLQPDRAYTFRLVRMSQYSGAFSKCDDVYPGGWQYWLGYSPDRFNDVSFRLYGS